MKVKVMVQFYKLPWAANQIFAAVLGTGYHHEAIKIGEPVEVETPELPTCPCCGKDF